MGNITQQELDKLILTPETLAHFSQPGEIKRLLIERETYKRAYEQQQKNIKDFETDFNNIMEQPVRNEYGRTQSLRSYCHQKYWEHTYDILFRKKSKVYITKFDLPKYDFLKYDINYDNSFITRFRYNISM